MSDVGKLIQEARAHISSIVRQGGCPASILYRLTDALESERTRADEAEAADDYNQGMYEHVRSENARLSRLVERASQLIPGIQYRSQLELAETERGWQEALAAVPVEPQTPDHENGGV